MKIVQAMIVPSDPRVMRYQATVQVTFEDGTSKDLFSYYDDELTFLSIEFIGKTAQEAQDLFLKRDMEYLRS